MLDIKKQLCIDSLTFPRTTWEREENTTWEREENIIWKDGNMPV